MNKLTKLLKARQNAPKRLSYEEEKLCWRVYGIIKDNPYISGSKIATMIMLSPQEVRKVIQNIRERHHQFTNPSNEKYLLASNNGYYISDSLEEQADYKKKLQKQIKSKTHQLYEIEITMERKKDD